MFGRYHILKIKIIPVLALARAIVIIHFFPFGPGVSPFSPGVKANTGSGRGERIGEEADTEGRNDSR